MHQHECRYCEQKYTCDEPADECFARLITCQECWFDYDFWRLLLVMALALVAVVVTIVAFHFYQDLKKEKPAFAAPVSLLPMKTTTGENYYNYAAKTNRRRADCR